ncbi:DUF2971 domain-containing protein [Stutzerimonas zhaodongensis]|uniref:DUF2971 domain-containing protein n=2 Tax=Stutzerimonas zhaodongensis TaxID=1176257 RepID=A0A3M2HPJ9_9GAMM|nr:DUF2971 domain-containing protein [Stutzerimonas zhaodongensis]
MASLFHYTDLNAVMSILQNLKLRATSIQYLNDSEEYRNGFQLISEHIKSSLEHDPDKNFGCYSNREGALQFLKSYVADDMEMWCSIRDFFFVTSFSRSPDQLSQWRGYGSYCLEFDEATLGKYLPLYSCIYDDEVKQSTASATVESVVTEIIREAKSEELEAVHWNTSYRMLKNPTIYKHSGFSEESEVRAVLECHSDFIRENILYRIRGDMLVPYVEMPIGAECIKSITVGPMRYQDLAAASLQEHLYKWAADHSSSEMLSARKVHLSRIPYRAN